jgi:hypothetical protein
MITRNQVFVRAQDENGKWGAFDALDLDDESFRMFILDKLAALRVVAVLKNDADSVKGASLRVKTGVREEPIL